MARTKRQAAPEELTAALQRQKQRIERLERDLHASERRTARLTASYKDGIVIMNVVATAAKGMVKRMGEDTQRILSLRPVYQDLVIAEATHQHPLSWHPVFPDRALADDAAGFMAWMSEVEVKTGDELLGIKLGPRVEIETVFDDDIETVDDDDAFTGGDAAETVDDDDASTYTVRAPF